MLRGLLVTVIAAAALVGCATPRPGPDEVGRAYARALRDGRLDDAAALAASRPEAPSREELDRRYPDGAARQARAEEIEGSLGALTAGNGAIVLVREADGWRVLEPPAENGARTALEAFLSAAESGDFRAAWQLLSGDLRARYTPERLEADFRAEPLATERLARARAALAQEPTLEGEAALFPIGGGHAVRLRREEGGYRVVSLE